jgi:hypothetical protein
MPTIPITLDTVPIVTRGTLGTVPLGSVVAIANVQAWALPTADQVKDGWALCNGNTFASLGVAGINYHNAFTGNRPVLNDSRFLMGSTTVSSIGGQNSTNLVANNIPQISASYTPTGTTNIGHSHSLSATNVALASGSAASDGAHNHYPKGSGGTGGDDIYRHGGTTTIVNVTTPTTTDGAHTHTVTGTTNIAHSHTLETTNIALAGTPATITVGAASPTAVENRPLYLSVIYVMRVL